LYHEAIRSAGVFPKYYAYYEFSQNNQQPVAVQVSNSKAEIQSKYASTQSEEPNKKDGPKIFNEANTQTSQEQVEAPKEVCNGGDYYSKQTHNYQGDKREISKMYAKVNEIISYNDSTNKKIAHINEIIKELLRSLCNTCGKSKYLVNNEHSNYLCNLCNAILCDDCIKGCSCTKCKKKICEDHCIKCCICNKRSCKDKCCIFDFRICQLCEMTYCQDHFDTHRKYNGLDSNKIKCSMNTYAFNGVQEEKVIKDFSINLIHCRFLKKLTIGLHLIKREYLYL
jgi:hypothetical protein